jgi:hypothetical protein
MTPEEAIRQLVSNYTRHLWSCCSQPSMRKMNPDPKLICDCGVVKLKQIAGLDPINLPETREDLCLRS